MRRCKNNINSSIKVKCAFKSHTLCKCVPLFCGCISLFMTMFVASNPKDCSLKRVLWSFVSIPKKSSLLQLHKCTWVSCMSVKLFWQKRRQFVDPLWLLFCGKNPFVIALMLFFNFVPWRHSSSRTWAMRLVRAIAAWPSLSGEWWPS